MGKLILIVDDDPVIQAAIRGCLEPEFRVRSATTGSEALACACQHPLPDLVLLDVRLPDMDGFQVCQRIKQQEVTAAIPVIFLSGKSEVIDITRGFAEGAVDYVGKPVSMPILLARINSQLRLCEAREMLRDQNMHLEALVQARTRDLAIRTAELQHSQELSIVALGTIAETRDNETGNHIHRTRAYVKAMAGRLALTARYRDAITPEHWAMIWKSAPLHDIGKVGIPDHILLKPGKLTKEEFGLMRRHPVIGRDALLSAETRMGMSGSFLTAAKEIAYAHHERWDGTGYPEGLSGETIPLSARLMALADVYDALISKRVYKAAMSHETAIDIIREGRGAHFDPSIVDCFLEDAEEFRFIAARFSDDTDEGL